MKKYILFFVLSILSIGAFASEADLKIPDLHQAIFPHFGGMNGWNLLLLGSLVIVGTLGISLNKLKICLLTNQC